MVVHRRRFEDGKAVYAKWPGSGYYYKAEVMGFHNDENIYSVKFSEGGDDSIYHIASKDMFANKLLKGGNKGKKVKKQSRSRSRSRSTSRSRKQSEKNRSSSKSPDRNHSGSPSNRERGRSPGVSKDKLTEVDGVAVELIDVHRVCSEKLAAITSEENSPIETITHSSEIEEITNNADIKQFGQTLPTISSGKTEETISNQDWLSNYVTKKQHCDEEICRYSTIKSLFSIMLYLIHKCALIVSCSITLLLPLIFIYWLYLSCSGRNNCSLLVMPKMPSNYNLFEKTSLTYVFGWFLLQAFIAALPFGRLTRGPSIANKSKIVYRLNGFLGLFISLMTVAALIYYAKFPMNIINEDYLSLITATYMFVLLVSSVVFVISLYSGKEEPSEGILQDFVFGRVRSPNLFGGKYDVKTSAFKAGFISWGVLNLVYLANVWDQPLESSVALILLVSFQLWYILDHMIFEETLYTSPLSSEKFGFTGLSGILLFFPLFTSLQARFLSMHPRTIPWSHYVLPCLLQVLGYFVYRLSVLEKFHFSKNPRKAKISGAVYISTSKGKDILVNGWWGTVRHPNYLGDLLMNCSWALLCGFSHFLPWIWVITLSISLMCMAWRDDALSLKKYGKSWEEYQDEVKYRIIPLIY